MLSACPTHAAVQKLKPSSIHVPLILPEQELCQCSHTDKPLLHKTLAMLSLHNQYKKKISASNTHRNALVTLQNLI